MGERKFVRGQKLPDGERAKVAMRCHGTKSNWPQFYVGRAKPVSLAGQEPSDRRFASRFELTVRNSLCTVP